VTDHRRLFNPTASFDAERARIAEELNVDVVVQLVDRQEDAVDNCWVHRPDQPREATRTIVVDGPNFHQEIPSCYRHAIDLEDKDYNRFKENADPRKAEALTRASERQDMTIKVEHRDREPDLGRNSMGIPTPADQQPPQRSEPETAKVRDTPPPPEPEPEPEPDPPTPDYDGDRLVQRCRRLSVRRRHLERLLELTSLNGTSQERVVSDSEARSPALQVGRVVVRGDPAVVVLRSVQGTPPQIVELSSTLLCEAGIRRCNRQLPPPPVGIRLRPGRVDGVPLEKSIERLTCAIASSLDSVMVGWPACRSSPILLSSGTGSVDLWPMQPAWRHWVAVP
jgi:hypothetical protein